MKNRRNIPKVVLESSNDSSEGQPSKQHTSMFLLTINSNKVIRDKKDPFYRVFQREISGLLTNITDYVKILPHSPVDEEMEVEAHSKSEIGTQKSRLHNHTRIIIKHNTRVTLDCPKISQLFGGKYYVNSTYIRGSGDYNRLLKYISKTE